MKEESKESLKRIKIVREAGEDTEALTKCVCTFFERGEHPDCLGCRKTSEEVIECRDYLLERLPMRPIDYWTEDFDIFTVVKREKVVLEEVVGIGINCDSCYMAEKCPLYKPHNECGIDWKTKKPATTEGYYDFLIEIQQERIQRAAVFEKVDGGVPDISLSAEMDRLAGLVDGKVNINRERFSLSMEASGPALGGGGILSKLFGAKQPEAIPETASPRVAEVIDVEPEEVRTPRKSKTNGGSQKTQSEKAKAFPYFRNIPLVISKRL